MHANGAGWSPKDIQALQRSAGNRAVAGMLRPAPRRAVQRALGVELEESNWEVTADPGYKAEKGTPIVDRPQFELQAEFGGGTRTNLEIVTKPPGVDEKSFPGMITDMQKLIAELDARQGGGPFKANLLQGGLAGFNIKPSGKPFTPFLQITVGVPLEAFPRFFDELQENTQASLQAPGAASRANVSQTLQTDLELDDAPSKRLLGFITLLGHYMIEGRSKSSFPKGSIGALAKTDFSAIFMMLPEAERDAIRDHLDEWVTAIAGLGKAADTWNARNTGGLGRGYEPKYMSVLGDAYHDPQTDMPPMTITTSREDWLKTMVSTVTPAGKEEQGRDILSIKGKLAAPDTPEMAGMDPKEKQALKLGKDVMEPSPLFEPHAPQAVSEVETGRLKSFETEEAKLQKGQKLTDAQAAQAALVDKLIADLKDFQAGFGALGSKSDRMDYIGETGPDARLHRSVIVEIRRPTGGSWDKQAMNIFDSLTVAINSVSPKVKKGPQFKSKLPKPPPAPVVSVTDTAKKLKSQAQGDLLDISQ
ncbi:MAG: hypothetical protein HOQ03_10645 [Thermoleophilia bacterium]|nr:hypothetical protein [Thermoleophilia bacterium]